MIRCQHCACMVAPGNICHGCGKIVLATDQEVDAARKELTARLQKFEGRKNDAETREELAQTIEDFAAKVPPGDYGVERCGKCGGEMEVETFYGGVTRTACPRCGQGRVENIPPPVSVVLDKDFKIVPPTRTDEGFDLLGQVGRVGRKTR